jgi:4-hydroxy-2-oxoheptanedioate aldolase
MRPSRVLSRLRAGGTATCIKLNLADPRAVEIAALAGVDSVWLDLEHVPNSIRDVEAQVLAARVHGVDAIVRVPRGSYSDLVRPLEAGAAGVMVPHVMGADDAQQVVRTVRFHPLGRRPVDGGNADGAFGMIPAVDYMRQANAERLVILQIEDPEALDELEQIAAIDGADMLLVGPADLSHALGEPGDLEHPVVAEAIERVVEAARGAGKFAGAVGSPQAFSRLVQMGYQWINLGADVIALGHAFRSMVSAVSGG